MRMDWEGERLSVFATGVVDAAQVAVLVLEVTVKYLSELFVNCCWALMSFAVKLASMKTMMMMTFFQVNVALLRGGE